MLSEAVISSVPVVGSTFVTDWHDCEKPRTLLKGLPALHSTHDPICDSAPLKFDAKSDIHNFPLTCSAFYPSRFILECVNNRTNWTHSAQKSQTQQQCHSPEILTVLRKINHRAFCEHFHVGNHFLWKYTRQLYHCAEGDMHQLMDERISAGFKHWWCSPRLSCDVQCCSVLYHATKVNCCSNILLLEVIQ